MLLATALVLALSQDVYGIVAGVTEPGRRVELSGTSFSATADATGRFVIRMVPAGVYEMDGRPIHVRAGQTTTARSGRSFSREDLQAESADDVRAALTAAPGVMLRLGSRGIAGAVPLIVRGDGDAQPAVWLDGAPVRHLLSADARPATAHAFSEVSIVTSGASAPFGDSRGGLIGMISDIGGPALRASARLQSDGIYNALEARSGGPLGKLRWSAAVAVIGQRSDYRGAGARGEPAFLRSGIDTIVVSSPGGGPARTDTIFDFEEAPARRDPFTSATLRSMHGRLLYTFGRGASLSLTARVLALDHRLRPGSNIYAPSLHQGELARSRLLVLNWGQPLSRTLALAANASIASEEDAFGPLTPESFEASRDPALGIHLGGLEFTGMERLADVNEDFLKRVRNNVQPFAPFQDSNQLGNFSPGRFNPFGVSAQFLPSAGLDTDLGRARERRFTMRWQLHWTGLSGHHVTAGIDADAAHVNFVASRTLSPIFFEAWSEKPRRTGLFMSDQLRLAGVQIDAGVRLDRYAGNGIASETPGRIFTDPRWVPDTTAAGYAANLATVFEELPASTYVSPRIAASYALTDATMTRFGYSERVELPAYRLLFANRNTDLSFANTSVAFGRVREFEKSSLLELGIRHQRVNHVIDVAIYRQDLVTYGSRFTPVLDPFRNETVTLALVSPLKAAVIGADVLLGWRPAARIETEVAWTFNRQEGLGDHAVQAALGWRPWRGLATRLTARLMTNEHFTRVQNTGSGLLAPGNPFGLSAVPIEPLNASRLPLVKLFDLRVAYGATLGGRRLELFADVRNLLDARSLAAAFAETGTEQNALHREVVLDPIRTALHADAGPFSMPDLSIDLNHDCTSWIRPADCVALQSVERRFGNGDRLFTSAEQETAFGAYYQFLFGPSRFRLTGRTIRLGFELR